MAYLLYLIIGLIAGSCTGLIGASGVAITVPALTFLGIGVHSAIGTSLAVDVVASVSVSSTFNKFGNLNLSQGIYMALAAIVGAQIASRLAVLVPAVGLEKAFGILLIINGIMFWRNGIQRHSNQSLEQSTTNDNSIENDCVENDSGEPAGSPRENTPGLREHFLAVILGLGIGLISGFLGAGGGVMILMVLVFVLHYPMHIAIGTSTLIMALTAFSASLGYAGSGNISLPILVFAGLGTIIGGRRTATFANKLSAEKLGKVAGAMFAIIGIGMCFM